MMTGAENRLVNTVNDRIRWSKVNVDYPQG